MVKSIFSRIVFMLFIIFYFSINVYSTHWDIDGWQWIDKKDKIELWQKKSDNFISECIVNITISLGCEVLRGFTIKNRTDIEFSELQCNNYPVGFWKIIYKGFDKLGNIYLKMFTKKRNIASADYLKIIDKITRITEVKGDKKHLILSRHQLFTNFIDYYLDKEGEDFVVDPGKIILINNINDLPAFQINTNNLNSTITLEIVELETAAGS